MNITKWFERIACVNKCEFQGIERLTPKFLNQPEVDETTKHDCSSCSFSFQGKELSVKKAAVCDAYWSGLYDPSCFEA